MKHLSIKKKQENLGQISILLASMCMTFLILFAFVISLGMLVHAKINLQNAADLAAYAGASVQARQLNTISFLNYEMRRQLKKFLFRSVVIGNMAQGGFPRGPGQSGPMQYIPDPNQAIDYQVPITCIAYSQNDNYCRPVKLPAINIPPPDELDTIGQTAIQQLQMIESVRQNNCRMLGLVNLFTMTNWLYNADPYLAQADNLSDPNAANAMSTIATLSTGLGLVPREILLSTRIETLRVSYVNQAPLVVNYDQASSLLSSQSNAPMHERTISAFFSAYQTLGDTLFKDKNKITLTELLPNTLLELVPAPLQFTAYALTYTLEPDGSCLPSVVPFPVTLKAIGYSKDVQTLTYYALRLDAEAQILFWPFSGRPAKMSAYAAARPFGSRIGPDETTPTWYFQKSPNSMLLASSPSISYPNIPNLSIFTGESGVSGEGWDGKAVVGTMYQNLFPYGSPNNSIVGANIDQGYAAAMNPNPSEAGLYNILSGMPDEFYMPFSQAVNQSGTALTSLWAPLLAADANLATLMTTFQNELQPPVLSQNQQSQASASFQAAINDQLQKNIGIYLQSSLRAGMGEDNEGLHVVRLQNPFSQDPLSGDTSIFLDEKAVAQYKSSWNNAKSGSKYQTLNRTGYSVKFVTLQSLQRLANWPTLSGEDIDNVKVIQH